MAKRSKREPPAPDIAAPYEIGYGKPPRAHQFRKGESGNPRGRPKGRRNLLTEVHLALNEEVSVVENGKRLRLTKRAVICRQLANRSAAGDLAALRLLLPLISQADAMEADQAQREAPPDPQLERSLAQALLARLSTLQDPPEPETTP
ncbi:DUF5681 domain-containing protein [Ralstonia sp. SET104]|uniref:DUF5681 domain-containing protein n=1 Tax=Ralstonia sp. SET104 TaxID=2448774 RepID=UPI000F564D50|nr:DUF5681 domain-containing protein [Ralstonia sp. SET104]GCB06387.1 hypothetical protein PSUB009319_40180 [Ralstonia sp. SET104]